jgi:RHS repeat-associated protein
MLIATYDTAPTGDPALHFQLADWLGTRRVQTDQFGNPEQSWVSLPFGDGLAALPAPGAPPTADDATEHHFTGKERDTESGNHYFGARYYASSMGRFMSPDNGVDFNTSDPQSWNLYSYVRNNPLTRIDPNGRTTVIIPGTGWSANDWTTNMKMANEARQEFHDPDVRILNWDGGYNPSSRAAGAQALRDIAATVPADQKLNVISHSRGGDVALDATHGISHKIDNLITLAMPNYSTEPPDTANIGLWINVTTFEDWVQKAAGDNGAPSGALNLTLHAPGYSHIGAHSAIWQNDGLRYQWWSFWSQHSGCHSSVTTDKVGGGTETTCAD